MAASYDTRSANHSPSNRKIWESLTANADSTRSENALAYLNDHHSGQLISRCLNDTGPISDMISNAVLSLARDTMMFLLLAGVMFYRDWST
jgi:ABC-type multidrug transport system fused ATPase/permease subunit